MTRDIVIKNDSFTQYYQLPLIADDVQAYRIVYPLADDMTGATLQITATRADGFKVVDTADINGNIAYYTLKNNMHSVVGETVIRLTLINSAGMVLTNKEIVCAVAKANGDADLTGDDRVPALTSMIVQATQAAQNANAVADNVQSKLDNGELIGPQGIPGIAGNRSATIKIAAHNASEKSKDAADYVCTGAIEGAGIGNPVGDEAITMQAISDLGVIGGCIELSEGTFIFGADLMLPNIPLILKGQGSATKIECDIGSKIAMYSCVAGTIFQDMSVSSGIDAIYINGCDNIIFRNTKIHGNHGAISSVGSDIIIDSCNLTSNYDSEFDMYHAFSQTNGTASISNSYIQTMGFILGAGLAPASPKGIIYSCLTASMCMRLVRRLNGYPLEYYPYITDCFVPSEETIE